MAMPSPSLVVWSDHAAVKAGLLSASMTDIEDAVLLNHPDRTANSGAADWLLRAGPWCIAYDHPADDDSTTAKIVTLWRP